MTNNSGQVIDTDLIPANIKSGVNIFGVDGSLVSGGPPAGANLNSFAILDMMYHKGTSSHNMSASFLAAFDTINYVYFVFLGSGYNGTYYKKQVIIYKMDKVNKSFTRFIDYYYTPGSGLVAQDNGAGVIYFVANNTGVYSYFTFDTNTDTFGGKSGTTQNEAFFKPTTPAIGTIASYGFNATDYYPSQVGQPDPGYPVVPTTVIVGPDTFSGNIRGTSGGVGVDSFTTITLEILKS